MPDQIDLSLMDSIPIVPNGFLRLRAIGRLPLTDSGIKYGMERQPRIIGRTRWKEGSPVTTKPFFKNYVKKGAKVLEAGCGVGQVVLALAGSRLRLLGIGLCGKDNQLTDGHLSGHAVCTR